MRYMDTMKNMRSKAQGTARAWQTAWQSACVLAHLSLVCVLFSGTGTWHQWQTVTICWYLVVSSLIGLESKGQHQESLLSKTIQDEVAIRRVLFLRCCNEERKPSLTWHRSSMFFPSVAFLSHLSRSRRKLPAEFSNVHDKLRSPDARSGTEWGPAVQPPTKLSEWNDSAQIGQMDVTELTERKNQGKTEASIVDSSSDLIEFFSNPDPPASPGWFQNWLPQVVIRRNICGNR